MSSAVPDLPTPPPSTLRTRPSLLFRLRDWQDEASWTEFYRLYRQFVLGCAQRSGLSHADAEEVTQDVFKRVAETIHEFESDPQRGSFRGWLINLTRWRVVDKLRTLRPHEKQIPARSPREEGTATIDRVPGERDLEAGWEQEWKERVLDAALARLARRVPAKHFQIFDLYRRQEWSVLRVARELGVNPATVYVISHRLTKQLQQEAERIRAQNG